MSTYGLSLAVASFRRRRDACESSVRVRPSDRKPRARLDRPGDNVAAQALVALLLAFQAGQSDQGGQPGADDDEAGFEFWAAVKSARAGDYAAALDSLGKARKAHDKLRFSRLRKAQNPNSDPTEEIFLKACKELETYWKMCEALEKTKYKLAEYKNSDAALEALVKGYDEAVAAAKGGEILPVLAKELGLKEEKPELKDVTDKIRELVPAKKLADELTTGLKDGNYISDEQKEASKGLQKRHDARVAESQG